MELRVVRFEGTLNIPRAITVTNKVSLRLRDSLDSLVLSSSSLLLILLVFSRSVCPFEDSTFATLDIALLNRFICVSSRETERQQTEISFIFLARKPVGAKAVFLVPAGVNTKHSEASNVRSCKPSKRGDVVDKLCGFNVPRALWGELLSY